MSKKKEDKKAKPVTDLLREDHKHIKKLLKSYKKAGDEMEKLEIVETMFAELDVHAQLEEHLIYPAIRAEIDNEERMDEALEEHHVVRQIMEELKSMKPGDDRYDAKVSVLAELLKHHIKEEEKKMLPKAAKKNLDWDVLCEQVMARRDELRNRSGEAYKNGSRKIAKKHASIV